MTPTQIVLTVVGIYNLVMGMITNTQNWQSAMLFKVIPFFCGLACLYAGWVLK